MTAASPPPSRPKRKARGGYSTSELARELGLSTRTLERWLSEGRIVPAFRTKGGHARFNDAQLAVARVRRKRSCYWQKIGPNGEDLGERGIIPGTARASLDAKYWVERMLRKRRIRSIKVPHKD